ncbi:hypothetical protein ACIPL1_00020 [Pseudomonas sp. NPDC090202]|uniref:hypothetical protein n=1 Tax=Pseudomonas sp. NPDC090202 TaxID=3364476 RepID=UPI0038303812
MSQEWKVVPVVPTDEMIEHVRGFAGGPGYSRARGTQAAETWKEMLAAAPVPPAGGEVEVLGYVLTLNGNVHFETDDNIVISNVPGDEITEQHKWLPVVERAHVTRLQAEIAALQQRLNVADQRVDELETLLNTPHTSEWFEGVRLEAGHQIGRWGTEHDSGKEPADWFWLIGYLAQKAMTAQMSGDDEKARHHTISTGAAMLNWFRAIVGDSAAMRPGIDKPAA